MSPNQKGLLGLIAALTIGALGNGVWEYVLEPMFSWVVSGILNVATLGVQAFKDELYREIAKGFHEESSLSLANALYYWVGYGVACGLFLLTRKTKDLVSGIASTEKELENLEAIAEGRVEAKLEKDIHARIADLRAENAKIAPRAKLMHKTAHVFFVIGIAFFAWMVIGMTRDRYVNSAIVHYEQSLSIVSPVATEKEIAMFRSRFAQISSKNQYEALISDIALVGTRGGFLLRDFKVR